MASLGDFKLGTTLYDYFATAAADTGAPTTLSGTPVVSVYEDNSDTQITSGVTLGVDADSVTGLNRLTIVATSGNGFEVGKQYTAVITTGTVGGTSAVGYVVSSFSIEKTGLNLTNTSISAGPVPALGIVESGTLQSATSTTAVLRSATSFANDIVNGATLVITGGTGVGQQRVITDWVSSTDTATVDTWTTTPDNTSTYIVLPTPPVPATTVTNITGSLSGSVGSIGSGGITTASFAAGAINAAAIADGAIDAATFAAGAINAAAIADGAIDAATFAASAITSTVLANDAITAAKVAADVATELTAANATMLGTMGINTTDGVGRLAGIDIAVGGADPSSPIGEAP